MTCFKRLMTGIQNKKNIIHRALYFPSQKLSSKVFSSFEMSHFSAKRLGTSQTVLN